METVTVDYPISFETHEHGRKVIQHGHNIVPETPKGRPQRISHLMALAIYFEQLIKQRVVKDYADIARLGYVTRARLSQIMNLRLLAPDIQEAILDLSPTTKGRDPIMERAVRPITLQPNWTKQRQMWEKLLADS